MNVSTADSVLWRGRAKAGQVVLSLVGDGFACTTRLLPNEITELVGQLLQVAAEARGVAGAGGRTETRRSGAAGLE